MSETSSPLIAPKKNVGLKDKLCMKLDIKLAQSFGFDLPKSGKYNVTAITLEMLYFL